MKIPTADGGEIPGYRAMPETGRSIPVILVVQEIFGVHEHIEDVCRRFAKLGYMAIAPEMYARQGDVSQIQNIQEITSKVVSKVPDSQTMGDLDSAVAWAQKTGKGDTSRLGITGFCWGGRVVWLYAAHSLKLKAGGAWYGQIKGDVNALRTRTVLELAGEIKVPVLGLYGGKDQGIPVEQAERQGRQERFANRHLSRYSARLPRGLPSQLSRSRRQGRMEAAARVVQTERRRLMDV